jgi:hypothetical protein
VDFFSLLNWIDLLFSFFDGDHFFALVVPAFGAYAVGQARFTAVGASDAILRGERIVRAAAVTAAGS